MVLSFIEKFVVTDITYDEQKFAGRKLVIIRIWGFKGGQGWQALYANLRLPFHE